MNPNNIYASLFDYENLYEACAEMMGFGPVTMKKDFGPLKKGEKYDGIWFHPEKGKCEIQTDAGEITHSFQYGLITV